MFALPVKKCTGQKHQFLEFGLLQDNLYGMEISLEATSVSYSTVSVALLAVNLQQSSAV